MQFNFGDIILLIFIIILPFAFVVGIQNILRAKASVNWPTVVGKILSSGIKRGSGKRAVYHAEISYEFIAENVLHKGTRVSYGEYGVTGTSHAQGIADRYPVGKTIAVHYMPGKPKVCVLEPGTNVITWVAPIFCAIFFVIACWMLLVPRGYAQLFTHFF